jgi:uncharacterized protein with PIN domain
MPGKLATWMRLLGCDVEYFPKISAVKQVMTIFGVHE